jgi:hypothetical protein
MRAPTFVESVSEKSIRAESEHKRESTTKTHSKFSGVGLTFLEDKSRLCIGQPQRNRETSVRQGREKERVLDETSSVGEVPSCSWWWSWGDVVRNYVERDVLGLEVNPAPKVRTPGRSCEGRMKSLALVQQGARTIPVRMHRIMIISKSQRERKAPINLN